MKKLLTLSALFVGLGFSAIAQDSTKQVQPEIRQEVNQKKHLRVDQRKIGRIRQQKKLHRCGRIGWISR